MPFAGFEDFDACLEEQDKRGHSDESARRICGRLQADFEKAVAKAAFQKLPITVQVERLTEPRDVETLEGTMHGNAGDWLVTGVEGEQYVVADAIFRRTFRPIDGAARAEWMGMEQKAEDGGAFNALLERATKARCNQYGCSDTSAADKPPGQPRAAKAPTAPNPKEPATKLPTDPSDRALVITAEASRAGAEAKSTFGHLYAAEAHRKASEANAVAARATENSDLAEVHHDLAEEAARRASYHDKMAMGGGKKKALDALVTAKSRDRCTDCGRAAYDGAKCWACGSTKEKAMTIVAKHCGDIAHHIGKARDTLAKVRTAIDKATEENTMETKQRDISQRIGKARATLGLIKAQCNQYGCSDTSAADKPESAGKPAAAEKPADKPAAEKLTADAAMREALDSEDNGKAAAWGATATARDAYGEAQAAAYAAHDDPSPENVKAAADALDRSADLHDTAALRLGAFRDSVRLDDRAPQHYAGRAQSGFRSSREVATRHRAEAAALRAGSSKSLSKATVAKGDLSVGDLAAGGLKKPEQGGANARGAMRIGGKKPQRTRKADEELPPEDTAEDIPEETPPVDVAPDAPAEGAPAEEPPPEPEPEAASPAAADEAAPTAEPSQIDYMGIPLTIDRPKGFVQQGINEATGEEWKREYKVDYGFIPNTQGGDGEGLDVFVGEDRESTEAHWIIQNKGDGSFDEYKIMLGFKTPAAAKQAYMDHVPRKFFGEIFTVDLDFMKALLGLEPTGAVEKALVLAIKAEQKSLLSGDDYARKCCEWAERRGLADAPVGKAVMKAGRDLASAPAGMAGLYGRAAVSFLTRAWDAVHATVLKHEDLALGKGLIGKSLEALSDASAETFHPALANAPVRIRTAEDAAAEAASGKTPPPERIASALDGAVHARPRDMNALGAPIVHKALNKLEIPVRLVRKAAPKEEQHYVLGIVLEPDVVDGQGDTYDAEEIRKSEWLYMERFRNISIQHKAFVNDKVHLVESYLAPVDMQLNGTVVKAGTWLMGLHVADEGIWEQIKSGALSGLSIAGLAQREEL